MKESHQKEILEQVKNFIYRKQAAYGVFIVIAGPGLQNETAPWKQKI